MNYASRLQRGQLPRQERIDGRFSSFATIWEPRDTIGGDLYWLSSYQQSGPFALAVADCTGHGVPGAMLSLLFREFAEKITAKGEEIDPVLFRRIWEECNADPKVSAISLPPTKPPYLLNRTSAATPVGSCLHCGNTEQRRRKFPLQQGVDLNERSESITWFENPVRVSL